MNKELLRLWIMDKLTRLQNRIYISSMDEEQNIYGQIMVLQELVKDFNIKPVEDEEIEFHNQI
jgi:hypothetical protein